MAHYSVAQKPILEQPDLQVVRRQLDDPVLGPYFYKLRDGADNQEVEYLKRILESNGLRVKPLNWIDRGKFLVIAKNVEESR